ncbi:phage lytic cycle repressor MrpR family protein [Metabacillus arenae]|uniref:Integrase n=1 Tax=Metabacillus arenae TaxID=2771434 RepID=A0A926N9B7_9BACI|nr:hypothetical protein [Metabacillus arenae]MBD1379124.1 hypothetical protein [Metabacillus arenae]
MAKIYNEDIKNKFLETFPETTSDIYKYLFYRSYDTEDILGRDLYTFTSDEIKDVLINANHTTLNAVRLSHQVISTYLQWAAENGLSETNINLAKTIKTDELRNFIDKSRKLYLSEEEIIDIEDHLVNYQDKALIRLIFEGVNGFQHSEILNLVPENFNEDTNELKLKDDKYGKRTIKVSDRCINIVKKAANETEYHMKNGEAQGRRSTVKLAENYHVIKTKVTRVENFKRADRHLVYRALTSISEFFKLPYLSPKNIEKSGMLKMAHDINPSGDLTNEELTKIADHFNVRTVKINGREIYNYSLLREFINKENIDSLYNQ